MQLSRKALNARWAWTAGAAFAVLAALSFVEGALKTRTGFGTLDLQGVSSGWGIRVIMDRWTSPPDSVLAGFSLGLDFLFIPLYAAALFFGAIAALDRFAPDPGRLRRIMSLLALAPIAGAICDVLENCLQLAMLTGGPTDGLARLALEATAAKYVGVAIGVVLSLMGLAGRYMKRRSKAMDRQT
jgi:hypothetical protein